MQKLVDKSVFFVTDLYIMVQVSDKKHTFINMSSPDYNYSIFKHMQQLFHTYSLLIYKKKGKIFINLIIYTSLYFRKYKTLLRHLMTYLLYDVYCLKKALLDVAMATGCHDSSNCFLIRFKKSEIFTHVFEEKKKLPGRAVEQHHT